MAYHPKKPMEIRAYYPNFVRYVEFFVDLFNPKWDDHLPLIELDYYNSFSLEYPNGYF